MIQITSIEEEDASTPELPSYSYAHSANAGRIAPLEKQSFTDEQKEYARALFFALKPFAAERPTMPLQHIMTFLQVVLEEGKGVTEYADKARVAQSVMTRHLLDIGERNRAKEPGYAWITQKADLQDMRRHKTFLSAKGRGVIHDVIHALDGLCTTLIRKHNKT